jgi:hypothetical protein
MAAKLLVTINMNGREMPAESLFFYNHHDGEGSIEEAGMVHEFTRNRRKTRK